MRDLFMSEHLWVNLSSRNMLCQLSYLMLIERNRHKSHRVHRRDREPSRIPIWSLKRLRKNSRKIRKFVDARIISCIPMSSTLYCYVNAKKLLNEKTFKFSCCETKFIPTESPGERKYASSLVGNLKPFFRESQIWCTSYFEAFKRFGWLLWSYFSSSDQTHSNDLQLNMCFMHFKWYVLEVWHSGMRLCH